MAKLFGTDGIRGEAGQPPLDPITLHALGAAVGVVLSRATGHAPRVVLGRDPRESGPALLRELCSGLAAVGAETRSAGVLPTPGISLLARSGEFDAGVMISASHNPWRDNGLKIFAPSGTKLPDELEQRIENEVAARLAAGFAPPPAVPPADEEALAKRYADWLVERGSAAGSARRHLVVALDCANGAASRIGPAVLSALGLDVRVTCASPDGRNINLDCGSLHPETVTAEVLRSGAALGIALDGDADRALFVDHAGRAIDGDQVLHLCAEHLASHGRLRGGGVVGTVMSNLGLEQALGGRGLVLVRERVGDRFVLERMQAGGFNLGGEPSGHVIFLDEAPTGDGLLTALQVLAVVESSGTTLADIARRMPRCPQVLQNVRVRERVPLEQVPGWLDLAGSWAERLGGSGRTLVRYSGTEKLVRVMVEGSDEALVRECAASLAGHLRATIGA